MDEKILPVGTKVMMSDRELLELAAKAAGYQLKRMCDPVESGEEGSDFFHLDNRYWNPLTEDGDAFRILIDLNLDLTVDIIEGDVFVCETFGDYWCEYLGDNPHAAARRAIVRAAADIGRAMPRQNHRPERSGAKCPPCVS